MKTFYNKSEFLSFRSLHLKLNYFHGYPIRKYKHYIVFYLYDKKLMFQAFWEHQFLSIF